MTDPTVIYDTGTRRIQPVDGATVWLAPIPTGGTIPVLRFSTRGKSYTVALTRDELERLADSADAILAATDAEVDAMLDTAALALRQHYTETAAARENGSATHRPARHTRKALQQR